MTVSTHVLDASVGAPATGVPVTLSRHASIGETAADEWQRVESGVTGPDGRYRFGAGTAAGVYRLAFGTGTYFAARAVTAFYPEVTITFTIPEPPAGAAGGSTDHFHVPLLLAPFAYSTYRGS